MLLGVGASEVRMEDMVDVEVDEENWVVSAGGRLRNGVIRSRIMFLIRPGWYYLTSIEGDAAWKRVDLKRCFEISGIIAKEICCRLFQFSQIGTSMLYLRFCRYTAGE